MGARERMFVTSLEQVRLDHLRRYEWAAKELTDKCVIDAACGCGYGASILGKQALAVWAVDASTEAVDFAELHWKSLNVNFQVMDLHQPDLPRADAVVSFETIEHLKRPKVFLRAACEAAPRLLISAPNESVMPHSKMRNPFHRLHYTKRQLEKRLRECGWRVTRWFGQFDKFSDLEPDLEGRTIIADCERA